VFIFLTPKAAAREPIIRTRTCTFSFRVCVLSHKKAIATAKKKQTLRSSAKRKGEKTRSFSSSHNATRDERKKRGGAFVVRAHRWKKLFRFFFWAGGGKSDLLFLHFLPF